MSKPPSGLFHGTKGDRAYWGDAETVIAQRAAGLDLSEHPLRRKQLSHRSRKAISRKIKNRTASREEYERYEWDRRFRNRRKKGVRDFWDQEILRLKRGERGTRDWTAEQRLQILSGKRPSFKGRTLQAHHTYSASKYPHLANRGEIIYPATPHEHLKGWHGGSYSKSLPGRRIRPINEF